MVGKQRSTLGKFFIARLSSGIVILIACRWHADIKPDNILHLEDRLKIDCDPKDVDKSTLQENEITFKLADPGFAKFVNKKKEEPHIPKEYMLGGTTSYGTGSSWL